MAITKATAGNYLGYTLSRTKPTLYFQNGRYTQVYPDANNIGWHPNGAYHRGSNINKQDYDRFIDLNLTPENSPEEREFISKFRNGDFDSDATDSKFFECFSKDGVNWSAHPSSSHFTKKGDASFDDTFNDAYADAVLAAGVLAPNG